MDQIPWQYSKNLKRYYVYLPSRDELVFRDGQRLRRPPALPADDLEDAAYLGDPRLLQQSIDNNDEEDEYIPRAGTSSNIRAGQQAVPRAYALPDAQRDMLTAGIGGMRIGSAPVASPFIRNPDNNRELITKINVSQTETLQSGNSNTIITSVEVDGVSTDQLHPSYKRRERKFFFVGKIFSILWAEPAGNGTFVTDKTEAIVAGPLGEAIFSKIRRFVVIRAGDNYCNALPILTYGGRGVAKKGVKKSEHAIIYTNPLPKMLPAERATREEEPMRTSAIRVDPDTQLEKLDPVSRINFGHVHTIQYNVRVKSCGKVASECQRDLQTQFAAVFAAGSQAPRATASAATSSRVQTTPAATAAFRSADNKIQEALAQLEGLGMSRSDAVRRLMSNLEDKGLSREQAADLLRKGLSPD